MVGVDDDKVESSLNLIRNQIPAGEATDLAHARVTMYILNVKEFDRV